MLFVYPALAWGFLLVLAPLLIHLINLLRHRRQAWAAMEFLLESYRKHRRWVWLKQLLLLLSRMAIMAMLVALLAQWISGGRWLSLLGQNVTHHYLVFDDSLSMGDTQQGVSAYDRALAAATELLRGFGREDGTHTATILRYSRAAWPPEAALSDAAAPPATGPGAATASSPPPVAADIAADILARTIPSQPEALLERLQSSRPVALDLTPAAALQTIAPLVRNASQETAIVYLFSDFRAKDWRTAAARRDELEPLEKAGAEIQLIDCATDVHDNLSIVGLESEQDTLAANVPALVQVEVRNPGRGTAKNVTVRLETYQLGSDDAAPRPGKFASGQSQELPPWVIDQLGSGETARRAVQVLFTEPGSHVLRATLPEDALLEDNSGAAVLETVRGQELLIVDADGASPEAFLLEAALNPGGMALTGWATQTKPASFLRDSDAAQLNRFAAILLINLRALDPRGLAHLEAYARAGGGIGLFLDGRLTAADIQRFNRDWHRGGEGLLPSPLDAATPLAPDPSGASGLDLLATPHPVFAPLLSASGSPFQRVRIARYVRMAAPPASAGTQIMARARGGDPILVDHPVGQGRVVLSTVGLGRDDTNWPQDPTFVVALLKLANYLASFRGVPSAQPVGAPLVWTFSSQDQLPQVEVLLGELRPNRSRLPMVLNATERGDDALEVRLDARQELPSEEIRQALLSPGLTEMRGTTLQGGQSLRAFARNAPSQEGELDKLSSAELVSTLAPLDVKYRTAEATGTPSLLAGLSTRQGLLLFLLVGLLMIEQWLAWSASYHLNAPARSPSP